MRRRVLPGAVNTAPTPGSANTDPDDLRVSRSVPRAPRAFAIVASMLVLSIGVVGSAGAAPPEAKLDQAKQRLADLRDRLDVVTAQCERNEQRVSQINTEVEGALSSVDEAELAVDTERRAAAAAEERLDELQTETRVVEDASSDRVVELYKRGGTDPTLPSLLASPSSDQALARAQVLNVVRHGDRAAIEELTASRTAVDAQRDQVQRLQQTYARALDERKEVLGELEDLRATYERKVGRCNDQLVELEQQERIAEEDEQQLAAALADTADEVSVSVPSQVSSGGWTWPAEGPMTSGFGQRWGRLHAGIDIGAPTGAPILAAKDGVVSFAGTMGGYGNIVVIEHGGGMTTRYAHQSQLGASVGQSVNAGDQVGYVGSTGNSTGPHLHFEVRINDQPQDPIGYLP
jgi:murein DD-endopeptidase MepM/ murein hydrolase activator NlpD